MSFLSRLRQLLQRPVSVSKVGQRRPTPGRLRNTAREDTLRAMLGEDPNDPTSFQALAEIVRRRAADTEPDGDPLSAHGEDRQRAADLAVWSLAEELAGNPRAWYPLIELARLSLHDDREGALRRLTTAADRDPSGQALAEGLGVLREAGLPVEALGLGIGHWRVREHTPEIARHLVLAAIEADRSTEARHHLHALDMHPDKAAVARLRPELEVEIALAEQRISGT